MVSSFLQYSEWFSSRVPAGVRIIASGIESLFSKLKFGTGEHLSAINCGSGLAHIQARTEVDRVTASGKGQRDKPVMDKPLQPCVLY